MKRLVFLVLLALSPAAFAEEAGQAPDQSLYDRLGGEASIAAVVDDFVARAMADPAVNFTREGRPRPWEATPENLAKLKKHLVQFISLSTGQSPGIYEGSDMRSAHAGMKITAAEFDALAADLAASLDKFNVPEKEKGELLAIAASTKSEIVEA